jgi:hypothetical protein
LFAADQCADESLTIKSIVEVSHREDSKMDVYTIAVIVVAIVVMGAFGYFVLRPEKLIK